MKKTKEESVDVNCRRKLDFNVPLISTRRHCSSYNGGQEASRSTNSLVASYNTNYRIPFCWEQFPGKPKEIDRCDDDDVAFFTPRPRLPPCRWHPSRTETTNNVEGSSCISTSMIEAKGRKNIDQSHHVDIADVCFDADIDDDDEDKNKNEHDTFSDAVETLSLTEAIDDIVKKAEEDDQMRLEKLNLESAEFTDDDHRPQYTNFMIERFLPDATALAESSVALYASMNMNQKRLLYPYDYSLDSGVSQAASSETSHRGCGFESFLPWRMKHKLCSIKSPVVQQVSPSKLQSKSSRTVKTKEQHETNRKIGGPFIHR